MIERTYCERHEMWLVPGMTWPGCPFVMPFGHQRCERRRFHDVGPGD